jgi:hypothetical protein
MFLDKQLCIDFSDAISSSPIFGNDKKYNNSLLGAVIDRIFSCVDYLNYHSGIPSNDPDFILFLVHCCMVKDAIIQLLKYLNIDYPYSSTDSKESKIYFLDVCTSEPFNLYYCDYKNDDKFFEYFRSLAFAHPFETDRHKWIQGDAKQYSPWVISGDNLAAFGEYAGTVGIKIYSDKYDPDDDDKGIKYVRFKFSILKEYINSRYSLLSKAVDWIYAEIERNKIEWRERKVKRNLTPIEMLNDIRDILIIRSEETHELDIAIKDLSLDLSLDDNLKAVTAYRKAIIDIIPALSDAIDDIDIEKHYNILERVTRTRPKNAIMLGYQLEKILCYLTDNYIRDMHYTLGLQQADEFSKGFAKKYVTIKPYEMSHDEIKLLVRTACYLEYQNQRRKLKVRVKVKV